MAFQVETALVYLFKAILSDGDSKQNEAIALTLPCNDNDSAQVLVSLTMAIANSHVRTTLDKPYVPVTVFGAWFNILRNPRMKNARVPILAPTDSRCTSQAGPIVCPWAEVLALESLKNQDNSVIGQIPSFYWYPHSLILASARFVLSPEYRQYHSARDQAEDANVLLSISLPLMPLVTPAPKSCRGEPCLPASGSGLRENFQNKRVAPPARSESRGSDHRERLQEAVQCQEMPTLTSANSVYPGLRGALNCE